jgi:hypothetical protein
LANGVAAERLVTTTAMTKATLSPADAGRILAPIAQDALAIVDNDLPQTCDGACGLARREIPVGGTL